MRVGRGARFVVLALATLAVCRCGEDRPPTAPTGTPPLATPTPAPTPIVVREPGDVRGMVVDFQTRQPVAGAVVVFADGRRADGTPVNPTQAITDSDGKYSLPPRSNGLHAFEFFINNRFAGNGYPGSTNYRADLIMHIGTCVSRYGLVMETMTFSPIAGARVAAAGASATTDSGGWYHLDWGCPSSGTIATTGATTPILTASRPGYAQLRETIIGQRGVQGVQRADVIMIVDPLSR